MPDNPAVRRTNASRGSVHPGKLVYWNSWTVTLDSDSWKERGGGPSLARYALHLSTYADVHPRRNIQLAQRIHCFRSGISDVDEPLVRTDLELLPALLVDVR